jgi:hypothetical protein
VLFCSASAASSLIETSSALAIALTVLQVGFERPRSIEETVLVVVPARCARSSWLIPRSVRSWRIAAPSAGCG